MIIVTGGAGFIGSHLARTLDESEVIIVDDFSTGKPNNLEGFGGRVVNTKTKAIESLGARPDLIFHLGMPSSSPLYLGDRKLVADVVEGAIAVFDLAVNCHARLVYASTSSLYYGSKLPYREDSVGQKPSDFYTEARMAVERLAQVYAGKYGLPSIGLRFFSVYGPGEESKRIYANMATQFIWAAKGVSVARMGKRPTVYGDGSIERDLIYVDDVVRALKLASSVLEDGNEVGSEVVNVGTGASHSFNEIIDKLSSWTGKDVRKDIDFVPMPPNYMTKQKADISKARRLLKFESSKSIDDGLKSLL